MLLMHRTTPKEEHLLLSLKTAIAAFDISLVKEIEAILAEELDHRRDEMREMDEADDGVAIGREPDYDLATD
jgi:hypothetical protein